MRNIIQENNRFFFTSADGEKFIAIDYFVVNRIVIGDVIFDINILLYKDYYTYVLYMYIFNFEYI